MIQNYDGLTNNKYHNYFIIIEAMLGVDFLVHFL
jgi:hypothetical protein